jgi:hypothetical protein
MAAETGSVEVEYGVLWREDGRERAGRLSLAAHGLELHEHENGRRVVPFDAIEWIEIRPPVGAGRERIVVKPRGRGEIELESVADRWIVHDLSERVLGDAYGRDGEPPAWHPGLGL